MDVTDPSRSTITIITIIVYITIITTMIIMITVVVISADPICPFPSSVHIHPVSITRFPSFRTQPQENLCVDSVNKWIPEQPSPWRKS